jgi:DNA recombination protein RmuC
MNQTTILVLLLIAVIFGFGIVLYILDKKMKVLQGSSAVDFLKTDVVELSRNINNLQQAVGDRLDINNREMQTSMQKQLSESAKLVADVTQRLAKLDETNRQVVDVASELKTLQNILGNPKQRGVYWM